MAFEGVLASLLWSFSDVSSFCTQSASKHEPKGYKYFSEQYVHDVKGEFYAKNFFLK